MPLRLLIVPDKFKGTLSAQNVAAAIAKGWKSARPHDHLDLLPMSDGGDGFGPILSHLLGARSRTIKTVNAARQPITAQWWFAPRQKLALIESARVIGLALLPAKKFHPFQLDTFGLGRVLHSAARSGATRCIIGIGGSATNDAGFGLARALGWKFLDSHGRELAHWPQLLQLHRILPPVNRLKLRLTVAVDVTNPLLGARGCSRIYGPQKGLRPADIPLAEKCLRRLGQILKQQHHLDFAQTPGAGAAGGLGFGLMTFAGARPEAGFEVFSQAARLPERIRQSDLVITGEGALDTQTHMGKGVGQLARLCQKLKVPCVALAGDIRTPNAQKLFWKTRALTDLADLKTAIRQPRRCLEQLAKSLAAEL